jgi:hypothetical protein
MPVKGKKGKGRKAGSKSSSTNKIAVDSADINEDDVKCSPLPLSSDEQVSKMNSLTTGDENK